eukprot:11197223-Lingulodinium_polyedra.AAC.1
MWLRRTRAGQRVACEPPMVLPLVKSKCFGAAGARSRTKAGHSRTRRVIDCNKAPFRQGWGRWPELPEPYSGT